MGDQAFISYSRLDKKIAVQLHGDLEARGLDTWIDFRDITAGTVWSEEIRQAILACPYFFLLLSPASVESDYVTLEYNFALTEGKKVIPILIEICQIPDAVAHLQYVDLRHYEAGFSALLAALPANIFEKRRTSAHWIAQLLSDKADLRRAAIFMIGNGKLTEAFSQVVRMLHDSDPTVRMQAAWALDQFNLPEAIPYLIESLYDPAFDVRSSAGWGLVHLGEMAVEPTIAVLRDKVHPEAQQMARMILERIPDERAQKALKE